MTTNWIRPTIVVQYAELGAESAHIPWNTSDNFSTLIHGYHTAVETVSDLYHYSRRPRTDVTTKTYYLQLTGFNFTNLPSTLSGIQLKIYSNRRGRITDDTIQLCLNGNAIGNNQATLNLDPANTYGGETNLWGTDNLTIANIQDPTFGIILRFQSHQQWPHKDPASLSSVELQIY
jgi:hypothetical protein